MIRPRQDWIDAVYGKDFFSNPSYIAPSSGSGLADIGDYVCYNVNLERKDKISKLGLSLTNLKLGLYVSKVQRHSEAEYAGIIPGSVLVAVNGAGLLCEMSVHALESVWLLEHCKLIRKTFPIAEMKFIHKGKAYMVHMFSNNFGIEWDSVGDFTVVQKAPREGDIKKGSLLLQFDELNFRLTSTPQFASSIVSSSSKEDALKFTFGFTPQSARCSSLSPSKSKNRNNNSNMAVLACTHANMHSLASKTLVDRVSIEQNRKQLSVVANLTIFEKSDHYPTSDELCIFASICSPDGMFYDKLKNFVFCSKYYEAKRGLLFNLSYHEVNYVQDRLMLVNNTDQISEATKNDYLFELQQTNCTPEASQFWNVFSYLEDISSKLSTVRKAKRTDTLRNILKFEKFSPISSPLDKTTKLTNISIENCHVLPSAHSPILFTFETNVPKKGLHKQMTEINVEVLSLKAPPGTFKVYGIIRGTKLSLDGSISVKQSHAWLENNMTFHISSNASTLTLQVTRLSSATGDSEEVVGECWVQLKSIGIGKKKIFYTQLCNGELNPTPTPQRFELEVSISKSLVRNQTFNSYERRRLLYKYGDDVRQEKFCLSLLNRMNLILRANGLDLCLRIFRCILPPLKSNESSAGMIEWVDECVPLSALLAGQIQGNGANNNWYYTRQTIANPILAFFRDANYDANEPYFVSKCVMESFSKSCAGYCVLTYLLGVGDRHTDNILLHPDGFLLHCDFSFLFGRDPKTYIPMRVTEEMVAAMGGKESDYFSKFISFAGAAFLILRRHENVRMMANSIMCNKESNLPDINIHQPPEDSLLGLIQRLRLDLCDDDALTYFEELIENCLTNKLWIAVDALHNVGKIL